MRLILNLNGMMIPIHVENKYTQYIEIIKKECTGYEIMENKPIFVVTEEGIKKQIYTNSKKNIKQYNIGNLYSNIKIALMNKKADILLDLKSPTKSLCGDCSSIQECKGCHAVPLNKKSNVCSWKIQNKNILDEFLEVEKVTY